MSKIRSSGKGICEYCAKLACSLMYPLGEEGVEPSIRAPFKDVGMDKLKDFTEANLITPSQPSPSREGVGVNVGVNIGVNEGVNIDVKGGYKTLATNLRMFNSSLKGGYKTLATNLGVFNSSLKGECKTFAINLGVFNLSLKERCKKCLA